jgi:hypothetical protein
MKSLSVLGIVSYQVFPAQMGGQKCVADFYSHLAKQTKVVLAVSKENETAGTFGFQTFPFLYHHRIGFANLFRIYRLYKLIKQEAIDVICIEHSYLGWLGMLLRWITKKPFIIRSHNIEALRFRDMQKTGWRLYALYERWVHRKADFSFFITAEEMQWAITHWQLDEKKCCVITYGTDIRQPVGYAEKFIYRKQLCLENKLPVQTKLFLFNGSFDYLPNIDALRVIISELLPALQLQSFDFRIFICGRWLSKQWQDVLKTHPEIIDKGMVDDIAYYYKAVDCFINPVTLGSGIKIKLIDALSYNLTIISARNGARGVLPELTGQKLLILEDYDWQGFAKTMADPANLAPLDTPEAFYEAFNWDTIVQKALLSLQAL